MALRDKIYQKLMDNKQKQKTWKNLNKIQLFLQKKNIYILLENTLVKMWVLTEKINLVFPNMTYKKVPHTLLNNVQSWKQTAWPHAI